METGAQPGRERDTARPDAGAATDGWAPMARDLATVSGILDDLPYPAHLCAVDPDRAYPCVAVNVAACGALGRTSDEVVGRPLAEIVADAEAVATLQRRGKEVVEQLAPVTFELAVELAGGCRRYHTTLVPISGEDGRCSHVFAVWNDATVVRETSELFRLLAENSTDLVVRADPAGNCLYVSPACRDLLGYEPDQLVGRSAFEWIHPDDRARVEEAYRALVDRHDQIDAEHRTRRADGTYATMETRARAVLDAAGVLVEIHATLRDVSQRVETERALRESEARLRAAAESGDKGFFIFQAERDDDGTITDFRLLDINSNGCRLLAKTREQVVGLRLTELIPTPDIGERIDRFAEVVGTGTVFEHEVQVDLPGAETRWLHQQVTRVGDGIAITTNDISARKAADYEIARRIEAERLISDLSRSLGTVRVVDLDRALVDVLARAAAFLGADAGRLLRVTPDGETARCTHEWRSSRLRTSEPIGDAGPLAPLRTALADGAQYLFARDLSDIPDALADGRRRLEAAGVRSVVRVAMRSGARLTGFITFLWVDDGAEEHERLFPSLAVLGDIIESVLERVEVERALLARTEAEALLTDISRGLVPLPPDRVDDAVVDALRRVSEFLGADAATLARFRTDHALVRQLNWSASERSGLPEVIPRARLPWLLPALDEREVVFVPDLDTLPVDANGERALLGAIGVRALAAFPLRISDRLTGLVGFAWRNETAGLVDAQLEGLHVLGDVLVAALERSSAEEAKRRNEERFRALVQHTSDVITVLDAEGRIIYHSPAVRQFGYDEDDLLGTLGFDLVHPDDRDRVEERFFAGLGHQRDEPVAFRLRGRDGSWHHVEAVGNNLLDDPAVGGVVLTTRDITERKQAEEALRASEERFRALVQNTSDIITVMDADGRLTYVSPAATRALGREPDGSEEGFDPLELVHPDDRARVAATYGEGVEGRPIEYRMLHADGSWRYMESVGANLLDDPAVRGVVVNTRDITERKQAEAERALHGEAERLISEISRELLTATERDIDAALEHALGQTARFVGAVAGGLQQYEPDGASVRRSHLWLAPGAERLDRFPVERATGQWFVEHLRHADHLVVTIDEPNDQFNSYDRGELADTGVSALAFLPVRSGGRLTAFVALAWFDPLTSEIEAVLPTLRVLADVFMAALDRTRSEAGLRESEARYRALVEDGPDLIFRIRRDGTYLDAHGRSDRMVLPPEETIGRTVHETRPREYADALMRNVEAALDTGELQTFEHDLDIRGEVRSFEIRIAPVAPDEVLDIVRDVTEREEAELALRRSEERFRALVQNTSDMITVLDADGTVVYTSPASEQILGWNAHERQGRQATDLVHPDDREMIAEMFATALARPGPTETIRVRLRHEDGSWRTIEAVGTNLFHDPAVRGFVVNGRDITERERLEAQLLQAQKMEAVGQLAGGVAHDFNNLLTAITGYVTLMLDEVTTDDPMHDDLVEIDRAAQRAATLVDQLLAFSRRKIVQPTVIDLNEVVGTMHSFMRRLLTPEIELETVLAPSLPGIRADRSQLEQVIMNLVVNARDAMPDGGPLLIESSVVDVDERHAAEHLDVEPGRYVCLAVTDRGTGMDAATRARIFEPFFSTKEVGKGTGLGLSTVYGIVNQAGGHVTVYSEPGSGTTFRVHLPIATAADGGAPSDDPGGDGVTENGHETILVAEDEAAVRSLAAEVLRRSGYRVLVAADGPEAIAVAEAHEGAIDLLVTDVVLPGIRGVAVADQVSALHPGAHTLFMSGYTESAVVHGGELTRDINFLSKPFRPEELSRCVREVLDAQLRTR